MRRDAWLVFAVAVGLYLPTARHGFVQDDRMIVALNPAAHSVGAALRAIDDPYWPPPSQAGMWRPFTILSFALDWTLGGGRPGWLHVANALWHGVASVLLFWVLARWLPPLSATAAALVFAVHPVHVEAVASIVGRADLMSATATFGAVLAVRSRRWTGALALAAAAMLVKETGIAVSVATLLYCWLDREVGRPPAWFVAGLAAVTGAYLVGWRTISEPTVTYVAAPFIGATVVDRVTLALSAVWRAATLLVWPARLSADYGPQVIAVPVGFTIGALGGCAIIALVITTVWRYRQQMPHLAWGAAAAALVYFPTSNLLFASGVVLAERTLYAAAVVPAMLVGLLVGRVDRLAGRQAALVFTTVVVGTLLIRAAARLPAWRSNRAFLVTLLVEHPESAHAHFWAAGVYAAIGDTAGARASFNRSIALFDRDPHVLGVAATFHLDQGDSVAAASLARRARRILPRERESLRVALRLAQAAGDTARAAALADSILRWYPGAQDLYQQ